MADAALRQGIVRWLRPPGEGRNRLCAAGRDKFPFPRRALLANVAAPRPIGERYESSIDRCGIGRDFDPMRTVDGAGGARNLAVRLSATA